MDSFKSGRFKIRRLIGKGTYGLVYEAFDQQHRTLVALKTLRLITADALYRFKREFRALARMDHPNLVRLYELFRDDEQWFFTMELLDGTPFTDHVAHRRPRQIPPDELLESLRYQPDNSPEILDKVPTDSTMSLTAMPTLDHPFGDPDAEEEAQDQEHFGSVRALIRQLAEGLLALHASGQLHRDIKPSNVLVTNNKRVVLLDFGLVADVQHPQLPQTPGFVGTPQYMSPEQALGREVHQATDWYSMGVLLYEALAGQLPFPGNALEILADKQQFTPAGPLELARGIPPDLSNLCNDLMRRDPAQRIRGDEVIRRLAAEDRRQKRRRYAYQGWSKPAFVGRQAELAALSAAQEHSAHGTAVVVQISGTAGLGKTALADRFAQDLRSTNEETVVLDGRCHEHEFVPYRALDGLVDTLCRYVVSLTPSETRQLLPSQPVLDAGRSLLDAKETGAWTGRRSGGGIPDGSAAKWGGYFDQYPLDRRNPTADFAGDGLAPLVRLFPVVARVYKPTNGGSSLDLGHDSLEVYRRAVRSLCRLLRKLARQHPLVLVLDDLQWGDADSARLLGDMLDRPKPPPLTLLLCFRDDDGPGPFVEQLNARLAGVDPRRVVVRRVPLRPMSDKRTTALTLSALGRGRANYAAFADEVVQQAAGVPQTVVELASHVLAEADLDGSSTQQYHEGDGERLGPLSLEAVLRTRLRRLPEAGRQVLDVLAVAGRPEPQEAVLQAAKLSGAEGKILNFLRKVHLVRTNLTERGQAVEMEDSPLRRVLLGTLPAQRKRALHRRLALVLEAHGGAAPEVLARHFELAHDTERSVEYLLRAADEALDALAFERAARLLDKALQAHPRATASRIQLLDKLASARLGTGEISAASQALADAAALCSDDEKHGYLQRAAVVLLKGGRLSEGFATFDQLLAGADVRPPGSVRQAGAAIVGLKTRLRLRGHEFREKDASLVALAELGRLDTIQAIAQGLAPYQPLVAVYLTYLSLLMALKTGAPQRVLTGLASECLVDLLRGGKLDRARSMFRRVEALATRLNTPADRALCRELEGHLALHQWQMERALDAFKLADELYRGADRRSGVGRTRIGMATNHCLLWAGRFDLLKQRVGPDLKSPQHRGPQQFSNDHLAFVGGWLALADDRPGEALVGLELVMKDWPKEPALLQHWLRLMLATEASLYTAQSETALDRLDRWLPRMERARLTGFRPILGHLLWLRARARLAHAQGLPADQRKPSLKAARKDMRRLDREGDDWVNGSVALLAAGLFCLEDRPAEAAVRLELGESVFAAAGLGLQRWVTRYCQGVLLGGPDGRGLRDEAIKRLRECGVRAPEKFVHTLAPGIT